MGDEGIYVELFQEGGRGRRFALVSDSIEIHISKNKIIYKFSQIR